jgi:hypothetical protein
VSPLKLRLRALGHELQYPEEPDLAPAVLVRLEGRPFPWRRAAAIALAVLVVAVSTAFAVPAARTAILRFFHLGGATVIRVETLPPAVERAQAGGLGRPLPRAAAERELGFRLALPHFEGRQSGTVYVLERSVGTVIVRWKGKRVLLSEFPSAGVVALKKLALGATVIDPTPVDGHSGLWIEGGPHTLMYFDRAHAFREGPVLIRGNVLIWVRGRLTLRLEGKLTRAEATALARSVT